MRDALSLVNAVLRLFWDLIVLPVAVALAFLSWHYIAVEQRERREVCKIVDDKLSRTKEELVVARIHRRLATMKTAANKRRQRFAAMGMSPADSPTGWDADVDGSGVVDVDDILAVMAALSLESCPPPCPADICCCLPHVVDVDDLIAVLFAFTGGAEICPVRECSDWSVKQIASVRGDDGELVELELHEDGTYHINHGQQIFFQAIVQESDNE